MITESKRGSSFAIETRSFQVHMTRCSRTPASERCAYAASDFWEGCCGITTARREVFTDRNRQLNLLIRESSKMPVRADGDLAIPHRGPMSHRPIQILRKSRSTIKGEGHRHFGPWPVNPRADLGRIRCQRFLGGLLRHYYRAA
jgi:hypothetical protein